MENLAALVLLLKELKASIKMSDQIQILKDFKSQLLTFVDELISQFPSEGDLVILRVFIDNQIEIKKVMDGFIYKVNSNDNKLRDMIKQRNEVFFINHDVFNTVNKDKVRHFKKLWLSGELDDEDKEVIWKWIDVFLFLSDNNLQSGR